MTEKEAREVMMKNFDYIQEVKEDGQRQEMLMAPPPPEPHNETQGSKACPGAPPWTTTTPNVQRKRPWQGGDDHRSRVYTETLLTTAINSCTMMGKTCREIPIAQLKEADKYDKARTSLQKEPADTFQDAVKKMLTDEDV